MSASEVIDRLRTSLAGRYDVSRELGRGGFATVFQAVDLRHGRTVAIKVLHPELLGTIGSDRFLREIQLVAHLNHPHILPLLDSGDADDLLYYVMPFVEGETLRDRLTHVKQLSITEALRITAEVSDGLAYAHSRNCVHRDIKPENILLSSGHAVISDFGIARAIDETGAGRLTSTGISAGSPAYMSPEQWNGLATVDGRADQYALACMLFEMLVGETPFTGPTPHALMARHGMAPIPSARVVRPNVPEAVEAAITRAMAKVPEDRFPTMTAFAEALTAPTAPAVPPPSAVPTLDPAVTAGAHAVPPAARATGVWPRGRVARLALPLAAILLLALGYVGYQRFFADRQIRIAVLPFENKSAQEDEYLVDGLTSELTNQLAGISRFGVIARASAEQYRKTQKTMRVVGEELNVQYLITGEVSRSRKGERDSIHVVAHLIRARDQQLVRPEEWDVAAGDVITLQSSIAQLVARELGVQLLEPERARLASRATNNVQAYEFYLRGNDHYDRSWSRPDVEEAVKMYQKAVEFDPDYAPAWARLAQAHSWMNQLRYDLSENRLVDAKKAADRAIAIDSGLPAARVAMGLYYYWGRSNYERAIEQFLVATSLEPSNALAFRQIGNVRRRQGLFDEAIDAYRKAADLDPRSSQAWFNLGETLLFKRDYDEAEPYLNRVTQLAPEFLEGYVQQARLVMNADGDLDSAQRILRQAEERIAVTAWRAPMLDFARIVYHPKLDEFLARIRPGAYGLDSATYYVMKATMFLQLNRTNATEPLFDSARIHLERMREDQPDQAWVHGLLGVAYAGLKQRDEAIRSATRAAQLLPVKDDALDGPEWVINLGRVHAMLGDQEQAVKYYAEALAIPSWISNNSLRRDPLLAPLQSYPAFQRLVSRGRPARTIVARDTASGRTRLGP